MNASLPIIFAKIFGGWEIDRMHFINTHLGRIYAMVCSRLPQKLLKQCVTIPIYLGVLGMLLGCTRHVHGGAPVLSTANSNGTIRIFLAPESNVLAAISNSITAGFHGMILNTASEDSYLIPNWHPTNGLVLFPLMGPITNVPLRGNPIKSVPYTAYYYLTTAPIDQNQTKVIVRTLLARVIDGQEIGVHGGWANHERDVVPLQIGEDDVIGAISNALNSLDRKR